MTFRKHLLVPAVKTRRKIALRLVYMSIRNVNRALKEIQEGGDVSVRVERRDALS